MAARVACPSWLKSSASGDGQISQTCPWVLCFSGSWKNFSFPKVFNFSLLRYNSVSANNLGVDSYGGGDCNMNQRKGVFQKDNMRPWKVEWERHCCIIHVLSWKYISAPIFLLYSAPTGHSVCWYKYPTNSVCPGLNLGTLPPSICLSSYIP